MSQRLLKETAQLRWWNESELEYRDLCRDRLHGLIQRTLLEMNPAWRFERVEGPMLVPRSMVNEGYSDSDLWTVEGRLGEGTACLRPETTKTTYLAAQGRKLPLCIWQVGKSFRQERNDGASAKKLRFFEFTQAEWQCIYPETTKADYRDAIMERLATELGWLCRKEWRIVPSDRLPGYSTCTEDIEVLRGDRWTEVCSVSDRTDFKGAKVLEIAVGLDRVVDIAGEEA